ncbi:hypothetical protein BDV96DRAFT_563519 [Lophiotrema nucula]|uniref:DNA-directed RNA polymerase n=1 Tax=Lophiotrema nucula TaxID=690887 RepID=A0A6A5ZQB6_9PLEO|nr:hypothetical protein BDV96DRAFT_563519 [Lophiotrema nucula]
MSRPTNFDPSKPLIINNELMSVVPTARLRNGIGGDPIELHQNLHACIRVGRLDRAQAIVQRLATICEPASANIIDAHNVYLRAVLEAAEQAPSPDKMAELEQWYAREMVKQAVEPTAATFVTLLRAAMTLLEGEERQAAMQKYLNLAAEDAEVWEEVHESADFSIEEFRMLVEFQPEHFEEPPPAAELADLHVPNLAQQQQLAMEHGLISATVLSPKAVPQKGLGLSSLKTALSIFELGQDVPYPHDMAGTTEEKDRAHAYMRQIRLEEDAANAAMQRWKAEDEKLNEMGIHGVLQAKPIQALMWNWHKALLPRIKKELQETQELLASIPSSGTTDERLMYAPYFADCDPERLAAVAIQRAMASCVGTRNGLDQAGMKITNLSLALGRDAESEILESSSRRREKLERKNTANARKGLVSKLRKGPSKIRSSARSRSSYTVAQRERFPAHVKARIGALLLDHLLQTATITVTKQDPRTGKQVSSTQRAFSHRSTYVQGKRTGFFSVHPELARKLQKEPVHNIGSIRLPMLVEPRPWTSFEDGAYYTTQGAVMRVKEGDQGQAEYASTAIEKGDMNKVLAGLDVLGKVPWNINSDVLRVMTEAWNAGEGIGKLVPDVLDLKRPADPKPDATKRERSQWLTAIKMYEHRRDGYHSEKCFQNFQLEIARAYKDEKFYFPHSIDFRGRAYPIPPILNHMGADMARGLLRFANGKELGAVGLRWLKIHMANLCGYDKASLTEREQFAMDHIDDIYDSATNPLGGKRWWTKAEDPWQCLGCCFELKNALSSPDPTRFVSHLPVHQDGTCNGLQHYAALGGDKAGADQVNLEPSDRPQDIYTGVAEIVKTIVAKDAEAGNPIARFIDGKVSRKVVKRTVMTNVYGVTFIGAKNQVADELKDIFPNFQPTEGLPHLSIVATYIAGNIFEALKRIFNGAQEIQYWLGECGERITTSLTPEQIRRIVAHYDGTLQEMDGNDGKATKALKLKRDKDMETFRSGIIWTTPLKMPVVQPYRKDTIKKVKTSLQFVALASSAMTDSVDKRKQLQAFPPNFIHSLDASHMLLSALKCNEMGLDFAAVHDSFWTHAGDIPNLSIVLRDAFVRMHSEDIVGRLAAEFKARYANSMYRADIISTSDVGRKITEWRLNYRRSKGVKRAGRGEFYSTDLAELALEAKRQELLKSENEEDRSKGEQMVTPTSIWLAEKDTMSLASFRLTLLGQTDNKKVAMAQSDEIRADVLGAEARAIEDDPSAAAAAEIKPASQDTIADAEAEAGLQVTNEAVEAETAELETGATHDDSGSAVAEMAEREEAVKIKRRKAYLQIWLPLTFPPVPKKGSWDVKRLKESQYFFS